MALEFTNGLLSTQSVFSCSVFYTHCCAAHLGDRFASRYRPYTTHQVKVLSTHILAEISTIWDKEISTTLSRPLRGMSNGAGDVYMAFLSSHYIVERWREGLLWAWVVGKISGEDGKWGEEQAKRAWKDVGGHEDSIEVVVIRSDKRETLHQARLRRVLKESGYPDAHDLQTKYVFCKCRVLFFLRL